MPPGDTNKYPDANEYLATFGNETRGRELQRKRKRKVKAPGLIRKEVWTTTGNEMYGPILAVEGNSIFTCNQPVNLSFSDGRKTVGVFTFDRDAQHWAFEGECDKSAQLFVDRVLTMFAGQLDKPDERAARVKSQLEARDAIYGR